MGADFEAARIDDAVGHDAEFFGKALGFGLAMVAVVVGVVLVAAGIIGAPFSLGTSLAATIVGIITILAAMEAVASLGGTLGKALIPAQKTGTIQEGARTVFVGEARKQASRVEDKTKCEDSGLDKVAYNILLGPLAAAAREALVGTAHDPAHIITGSQTVHIEGKMAARVGDKTKCGGAVIEGEKTVFIYGETASNGEVANVGWIPWMFDWGLSFIEWGSLFTFNPVTWAKKLGKHALKRGAPKLAKTIARQMKRDWKRSSNWQKFKKLIGAHDDVSPVVEDLYEIRTGREDKSSQVYNSRNDAAGIKSAYDEIKQNWKGIRRRR